MYAIILACSFRYHPALVFRVIAFVPPFSLASCVLLFEELISHADRVFRSRHRSFPIWDTYRPSFAVKSAVKRMKFHDSFERINLHPQWGCCAPLITGLGNDVRMTQTQIP